MSELQLVDSLKKTNLNQIKETLEKHHAQVVEQFHKKHADTIKFAKNQTFAMASATILTAATLVAGLAYNHNHASARQQQETASLKSFVSQINSLLTDRKTLNAAEEKVIAEALSQKFGLNLKAVLDGNRLNEIYGYFGKEQHLRRWAGDVLAAHTLQNAGMAPRQGSFKDFDNIEQEKYYVAVQLHELPNWNAEWSKLKPWYKYRKVFVFNPENQKGIIAVIGDSGPAKFTGKTFGGSPEVMDYLEMEDGAQKGKAIVLFVDDAEDKISLGPVSSPTEYLVSNQ